MTLCVRYVQNTIAPSAATIPVGSTGKDSQLLAFDITCTGGIAANSTAVNIFQWTGAGRIQSIMNYQVFSPTGLINVPVVATGTTVTIDATGKFISVNIATNGTAIAANSIIKLLLVIGNY